MHIRGNHFHLIITEEGWPPIVETTLLLFLLIPVHCHRISEGNHPKQAGLTWPKKKKSQGIILAISCSNMATSV